MCDPIDVWWRGHGDPCRQTLVMYHSITIAYIEQVKHIKLWVFQVDYSQRQWQCSFQQGLGRLVIDYVYAQTFPLLTMALLCMFSASWHVTISQSWTVGGYMCNDCCLRDSYKNICICQQMEIFRNIKALFHRFCDSLHLHLSTKYLLPRHFCW